MEHVLPSGCRIVVRPIQPSDAPELRRCFTALSPETRYRRFFGALKELDDRTLEYLTRVDGRDHVALVATTESLDLKSERGIGVARFVRSHDDPRVAEAAVVVVDDMQHCGVGTVLTEELAQKAREVGVERFRCEVLASNDVVVRALLDGGGQVEAPGTGREPNSLGVRGRSPHHDVVIIDIPIAPASGVLRALRTAAEQVMAPLVRWKWLT